MPRKPFPQACRECGADMGRGWNEAPLCKDCGQLTLGQECICVPEQIEGAKRRPFKWNPLCEVHAHDPYDIPF